MKLNVFKLYNELKEASRKGEIEIRESRIGIIFLNNCILKDNDDNDAQRIMFSIDYDGRFALLNFTGLNREVNKIVIEFLHQYSNLSEEELTEFWKETQEDPEFAKLKYTVTTFDLFGVLMDLFNGEEEDPQKGIELLKKANTKLEDLLDE